MEDDFIILNVVVYLERNYRSFEDRKTTTVELKAFFFNTLHHWTITYACFYISSFYDFLNLFSFCGLVFLFYTCVLGYLGCTFSLFNEFLLLFLFLDK